MDEKDLTPNHPPKMNQRLLTAVVPVLLISIGYVDPGKWAAAVEGGPHFGFDLLVVVLAFSFAAALCQYLSVYVAVITEKNLAQICSEEYDTGTRICLGILTELSMIALDLTMILGTAHCLNMLLGMDLFNCVFLTVIDALIYPVFANFLDNRREKFVCIWTASFILLFYVFGVLFSQQEATIQSNGMLTKLTGESAFVLMSLLGASIMPHNIYLHSSIVQQDLVPGNISKEQSCHDHLFAVICIFSGIFLVNCMLMNSSANAFFSTGLVMSTFQDALSLMDQAFRSSMALFVFLVILHLSNQITALTWNLGRQAVLSEFFKTDIPGWLHHTTIRIVALIPALYCVWSSGAEGIYQLLIFTQVVVALVLPSSVIPLFRVASSRSIMGANKISPGVEFLVLVTFVGMLGLKIIFLVEMIFGNSDWVGNLRWNIGSNAFASYTILLVAACMSLCMMLWLAATPLKSASTRLEPQILWDLDTRDDSVRDSFVQRDEPFSEIGYNKMEYIRNQGSILAEGMGNTMEGHSSGSIINNAANLPELLLNNSRMLPLTTIEESTNVVTFPTSQIHSEQPTTTVEKVLCSATCNDRPSVELQHASDLRVEPEDLVEKTVRIEGDTPGVKDDEESIEPQETTKGLPENNQTFVSEGPGSYRSMSGKNEESGSGAGSLSRLAGLGRAARRQLAIILDEFWGQLYDFHGQATEEAKAKKLDGLIGADSKPGLNSSATPFLKAETNLEDICGYNASLKNIGMYNSPNLHGLQNTDSANYGIPRGGASSAFWSSNSSRALLDQYVQSSSYGGADPGERRYSSLRLPPSFDSNDHQPATVHGYQIQQLSRLAKERGPDFLTGQMEAQTPKSPSFSGYRDPLAPSSGRKAVPTAVSSKAPPGFSMAQRNKAERSFKDQSANVENQDTSVNTKKYHSLPDISGLSLPYRTQQDRYVGYGSSLYYPSSMKASGPLTFDELSPSRTNTGGGVSMWSRQPYEHFSPPATTRNHAAYNGGGGGGIVGDGQSSLSRENMELKLLQSFRQCIIKLLKLEGSDWLFKQNDGADEDLIDRVAARERFLYEAETREMGRSSSSSVNIGDGQYSSFDNRKHHVEEMEHTKLMVSSVPHCGEGCVWRVDLIISFGVWCIHRILDLSLMESRPELWGKYTYVLNRLQGIINPAFGMPRSPLTPCICLQIAAGQQQHLQSRANPPAISNGSLPPPAAKLGRGGKCTTAAMLVEMIKDVEIAISCRKGRSGTAAGDVAFPKGKENLASVLKRYKRRLSNKTAVEVVAAAGGNSRRAVAAAPSVSVPNYGL
ncbi:ethylene-insensitive protein 2 [Impatiens glandulifera]|uniref:ethylene-insensitive protein 2 n=1 Tax=Impatiens glandulifera TaxID=253017 RepID=UPI001FB19950|nr:ethylene-insensitive protein 2 [Impatiens glandulifera]